MGVYLGSKVSPIYPQLKLRAFFTVSERCLSIPASTKGVRPSASTN
jgi:hypothetical protein